MTGALSINAMSTRAHPFGRQPDKIRVSTNFARDGGTRSEPQIRPAMADDASTLLRPEACLTLDQIDRHPVSKILGTPVAGAVAAR